MRTFSPNRLTQWAAFVSLLTALSLRADQLQMQNGDRYAGHILSMTSNSIVLESEMLGKVTVPREKVSGVTLGANATPNAAAVSAPKSVAGVTNIAAALQARGEDLNTIEQVRQQMLDGADPAATQKYNELAGGLMSGKLGVNDIRNEARSSIEQINRLKRELGPEADDSLDSYLTILQAFVNDTTTTATKSPSTPTVSATPARPPAPYAPVTHFSTNSAFARPAK